MINNRMNNKYIYTIILIISLSGCVTIEEKPFSNSTKIEVKNTTEKKQFQSVRKNEPNKPKLNNPYYEKIKEKEKLENYYTQEKPGKYIVTPIDKKLSKTYTRRYVLKFQPLKPSKAISWNEKEKGPYGRWNHIYEPLKIERGGISVSGKSWKVNIDEEFSGEFKINGVNSLDQKIDKKCKTLLECLNML